MAEVNAPNDAQSKANSREPHFVWRPEDSPQQVDAPNGQTRKFRRNNRRDGLGIGNQIFDLLPPN